MTIGDTQLDPKSDKVTPTTGGDDDQLKAKDHQVGSSDMAKITAPATATAESTLKDHFPAADSILPGLSTQPKGDTSASQKGAAAEPLKTGDQTPSKTADQTPSKTGDQIPSKAGDQTPSNTGAKTPSLLDSARSDLVGDAQRNIADPSQRENFQTDMKFFENRMGPGGSKQVSESYGEAARMLNAQPNGPLTKDDDVRTALGYMHGAAHPEDLNQGHHLTCNVSTIRETLLAEHPEVAGKIAADAITNSSGQVTIAGREVDLDLKSMTADKEARTAAIWPELASEDGLRNQFGQVMDHVLVNTEQQRSDPAARFTQDRFGDHLSVPGQEDQPNPQMTSAKIAELNQDLLGRDNLIRNVAMIPNSSGGKTFNDLPQMNESITDALQKHPGSPVTILVNANGPAFTNGGIDSSEPWHVTNITNAREANGHKEYFENNSWGTQSRKWVTDKDLFDSTFDANPLDLSDAPPAGVRSPMNPP